MSVEKIKMMNRSKNLSKRILTLNAEKVAIEKEQMDVRHNCQHDIIARDKQYGFAECIFCGNNGFSECRLRDNPAVIVISKLENDKNFWDSLERVRKRYREIWAEDDELSEEKIRERLREEFEEK